MTETKVASGLFPVVWKSFYSSRLYHEVAHQWRGPALMVLFAVVVLCSVPSFFSFRDLSGSLLREAEFVAEQLPTITIKDGVASLDGDQPRILKNSQGQPVAILDTTGKIKSLEGQEAAVLLTAHTLVVKGGPEYPLSKDESVSLSPADVRQLVQSASQWLPFAGTIFVILMGFVGRALQALVFAAAGLLLVRRHRVALSFWALYRLAVVALIPLMVFQAMLPAEDETAFGWWLIGLFLTFGYLSFGIRSAINPLQEYPSDFPDEE